MKVKLWGVRGSLPRPESPDKLNARILQILEDFHSSKAKSVKDFADSLLPNQLGGYGGNTSCMEVFDGDQSIIIDCGSGIKDLGMQLMAGPAAKGNAKIDILITHFHWDHVIGLPFFIPIFIPGNEITFYGVQEDLGQCIKEMFKKPFFPVDFAWLPSKIRFEILEPRKTVKIDGLDVTPYQLDHPDPCWGYRIEKNGRAYAHCVDTEATRVTEQELGKDLGLYKDTNLMVFDGQYTLVEVIEKVNWGHAVAGLGLDIAMREKIDHVVFVHHDPYATHEKIQAAIQQTQDYYQLRVSECKSIGLEVHDVTWEFGFEGMVLDV
ncbi:MAG: MBL fold metallo-hydrolase [Bdellovibrionales bacterium]|nr:MBL fold metallo-hydrolase [Bdellovibrionales bacterium]